jgi:hypothetical protein
MPGGVPCFQQSIRVSFADGSVIMGGRMNDGMLADR